MAEFEETVSPEELQELQDDARPGMLALRFA